MKNGSVLSPLFQLPNLEKESVADLQRWIVGVWSTRCFTWFAPAAPGGCCRATLVLGKLSMAAFGAGVRIGPGHLFTTRCAITCARPKNVRWPRRLLLLIASRSRCPTKRESAATTRGKRCRDASATWRWTAWDCFFFQAEDGIRDLYVTGVQTCALPIFREAGFETVVVAKRETELPPLE